MLKAALKDREERLAALAARLADMEGKMKVRRPPTWQGQLLCFPESAGSAGLQVPCQWQCYAHPDSARHWRHEHRSF